jgi:hypothetical protein
LTLREYEQSWARDPYDPDYKGVDRTVLASISDAETYDDQFPMHPLSKIRRTLTELPGHVRYDP